MHIDPKVYIAQTTLRAGGPGGATRTFVAGERILDFAAWPFDNQMCLLHLGQVKEVGGKHRANLSVQGGYLHFESQAETDALNDATRGMAAVVSPAASTLDVAGDAAAQAAASSVPQNLAPMGRITVVCPECQKVCNGNRGLILHRAKAHAQLS